MQNAVRKLRYAAMVLSFAILTLCFGVGAGNVFAAGSEPVLSIAASFRPDYVPNIGDDIIANGAFSLNIGISCDSGDMAAVRVKLEFSFDGGTRTTVDPPPQLIGPDLIDARGTTDFPYGRLEGSTRVADGYYYYYKNSSQNTAGLVDTPVFTLIRLLPRLINNNPGATLTLYITLEARLVGGTSWVSTEESVSLNLPRMTECAVDGTRLTIVPGSDFNVPEWDTLTVSFISIPFNPAFATHTATSLEFDVRDTLIAAGATPGQSFDGLSVSFFKNEIQVGGFYFSGFVFNLDSFVVNYYVDGELYFSQTVPPNTVLMEGTN